ncbi:hypothetical protein GCM10010193_35320 [Kitasatospora atroaurantiaca]|nr:hypothetical protein [Kitasatospora atroaurantiaca]
METVPISPIRSVTTASAVSRVKGSKWLIRQGGRDHLPRLGPGVLHDLLAQVAAQLRHHHQPGLADHQHLGVDHVQQQRCRRGGEPQPLLDQAQGSRVARSGQAQQQLEDRGGDQLLFVGPSGDGPLRDGRLEAALPAADARFGRARHRQVADVPGAGAEAAQHGAAGGDRRVHHIADEQLHQLGGPAARAEQQLRLGERPGVAVHVHRQPGHPGELAAHRNVTPAERAVLHHRPALGVDPAAGHHAEAEQ